KKAEKKPVEKPEKKPVEKPEKKAAEKVAEAAPEVKKEPEVTEAADTAAEAPELSAKEKKAAEKAAKKAEKDAKKAEKEAKKAQKNAEKAEKKSAKPEAAPVAAEKADDAEKDVSAQDKPADAVTEQTEAAEAAAETAEVAPAKAKKPGILDAIKKRLGDDGGDNIKLEKGSTKIKYRILRLCVASVAASVVVMQVYNIISTVSSYNKSYTEQAQSLVTSYLQTIDTKLDAMTLELTGLKGNSAMVTVTDTNVMIGTRKAKLTELATATMFKFIDLADMDGHTLNETTIADREYFLRARDGINTLSSPLVRRTSNTGASDDYVMVLGVKFNNGAYEGVLTGGVDPKDFSAGLDSISAGNNVIVLDNKGTVVAASDLGLVNAEVNYLDNDKAGYRNLANAMMSGETGVTRYTVDGVEYLAAYSPIELTNGWTIAVSLNYSSVTSEMLTNVIIALVIAVLVIVVCAFIAIGTSNKIAKPITVVANRLQLLSEGDISTEFDVVAPKDETRVLTDSLGVTITELNKYIGDIKTVLAEIADGDLTAKSKIEYRGDFTAIGGSLEQITGSLSTSFSAVKDSVDSIKSGAAQVADGSQHLSDTAIKEAEAVDEIISTIGGIAEQANTTAQVSNKVLNITNEANENAQRGADMMKELLAAIQNIKDKSDAISAIIKTIDSIAFQTNILALNASIEAARAGEAGRGFSVVAEEVGNLASMSADAVKQTSVLINDSIAAVNQGTKIADRAETAIRSIAADVNEVAGYMDGIVTAANEQNAAVEQITAGINRIDSGMHLTTATAEQSAASSEQLSELAVSLATEVGRFKTE
ncbi:MAG: methyl-accepting chemotaxis protein, partial [Oscillospiraceae bacterium]|nr:methyl-accepting chemotaxis protein [Oscillospiraceae bacterium]